MRLARFGCGGKSRQNSRYPILYQNRKRPRAYRVVFPDGKIIEFDVPWWWTRAQFHRLFRRLSLPPKSVERLWKAVRT